MSKIPKPRNKTNYQRIVIVESPAKCEKIENYLGPGYKVIASYGHLRELSSLKSIDVEKNFAPKFEILDDVKKRKHIESMKRDIASADEVILATDDDREGEAIAWHICDMFRLSIEKTKRIIFHEITETAIQQAIQEPKTLNMNLVHAQLARQVLDILVGFKVTPYLWKHISRNKETSLSAGRCQTPALKIIYDNYLEIKNSPGDRVYSTKGYFTTMCIPFDLNTPYETGKEVEDFLEETVNHEHIYNYTNPVLIKKEPPHPLTTSRIQQLVSNELHISPKETMKHCQILYEKGYITYMRTDSKTYSKDFVESVKSYLEKSYDPSYIHPCIDELVARGTTQPTESVLELEQETNTEPPKKTITKKSSKSKKSINVKTGVPCAHEAIRPTNIQTLVTSLSDEDCDSRTKKIYHLIWTTTLESCMSPATYHSIRATVTAPKSATYSCTSEMIDFMGWKKVKSTKEKETDNKYVFLQTIKQGTILSYKKVSARETMKHMKSHIHEAKLVQLLEEKGIGRPSTFSTIVEKIQHREYVKKENIEGSKVQCTDYDLEDDEITESHSTKVFGNEKGKLVIQPLGILVMEFLNTHFQDLFNYDYTREMEEGLDKVAKGERKWTDICAECLTQIDSLCETVKEEPTGIKIDENHQYIIGKHGPIIKQTTANSKKRDDTAFIPVRKDIDLEKLKNGEYALEDIVDNPVGAQKSKLVGKYKDEDLFIKKGKFGLYASWGKQTTSLSSFGNRPMENITLEEVLHVLENPTASNFENVNATRENYDISQKIVRTLSSHLSVRSGRFGDYIYYKTAEMKKPTFLKLKGFTGGDYKTCSGDVLQEWITSTYLAGNPGPRSAAPLRFAQ